MKLKFVFLPILTVFLLNNLIAGQSDGAFKSISNGITYQCIGQYSKEKLDTILSTDLKKFTDISISFPPTKNAVNLYKVRYKTLIPEQNNRPVSVEGLIAIPDINEKCFLPVVSYQHGTLFGKNEVPSQPDNSMETQIALAAFGGQGYIVIAADYIGQGTSDEPNSWLIKESAAQACLDMLPTTQAVCADLGVTPGDLFLSGWSQGSFSSLAFLYRLENIGIQVNGAAMASSPNDVYLAFNRWIFAPTQYDAAYLVLTAGMLVFAYENYYSISGLSTSAIKPEYWQTAKDFYDYKIDWQTALPKLPSNCKDLFQANFLKESSLVSTQFFKQLQLNNSYNWRYKTKTRFYYGKTDEVVTPYMVQLPVEYQKTLGAEVPTAVYAGDKANHRGTFVYGIKDQQEWFASLKGN